MQLRGYRLTLAAVLVVLLASVGPVSAVPDARLTVSDVTVTPTTPVVGEQVVVTVSIANSVGSPSSATVDEVRLSDPADDVSASAQRLGSLSAGDSVTVPLAVTFETPGPRTLSLTVLASDEDGETVRLERPVPVAVEDAPPLVDVSIDDAVVDGETRVAVALSNPTTADMRNIVVSVTQFDGDARVANASIATLPAGATAIRNLTVVPAESGTTAVELQIDYTTASGTERTRTVSAPIRVAAFADDVQLTLRPVREGDEAAAGPDIASLLAGGGAGAALGGGGVTDGATDQTDDASGQFDVAVTNFGSAPIRDVVVTPTGPGESGEAGTSLPRLSIPGPIAPGDTETAVVDLSGLREAGPLTLRATYQVGVQTGESVTTVDYRPAVADLVVTDVDVTVVDGEVRLLGNVANQGRGDAEGVVVELVETEAVTPTYPQRDYFVGRITPNDFAPFELTGTATGDATNATVTLRYTVDGVEIVREAVLDLPTEGRSGGGFGVGSLAGGVQAASQDSSVASREDSTASRDDLGSLSRVDRTTQSVGLVVLVTLLALPVAVAIRLRRPPK